MKFKPKEALKKNAFHLSDDAKQTNKISKSGSLKCAKNHEEQQHLSRVSNKPIDTSRTVL